jgi:hypothetical protein
MLGREGLLPAPLERLRVETLGGERFQTLSRSQFDAAALRAFETAEDGDVSNARFYSWHEFGEAAAGATVLARFADQTPFALRKRFEPGCAILLACGLSGRTSNVVVREFYLPLVFRLLTEAASGGIYPRTVSRGEPLRLRLKDTVGLRAATFSAEGGEAVPLAVEKRGEEGFIQSPAELSRTGLCSIMLLREGGASRVWFGVQGPRVDSDLSPMSDEQKAQRMESLGCAEARSWAQLDEMLKSRRRGAEWHHWVMAALLAVLLGEMLIQRRFA